MNTLDIHPDYSITPLGLALELGYGWDYLLKSGAMVDTGSLKRAEELFRQGCPYIEAFLQAVEDQNLPEQVKMLYVYQGGLVLPLDLPHSRLSY